MSRILIAIDGSKASMKAIEYVVRRKRRGEDIDAFILNVQPSIPVKAGFVTRGMIKEFQQQESDKVLGRPEIKPLQKYLKADAYVEIGEPAACIVAFAKKTKCEEIVVGSRGLGGVKGVLLGSIASKVIQISPLPVVVVK